ncbi:MerR family transcriptional regulator [Kitasatospora sp. LaBMicrA B282]|uniref:DNA polymerase III subunit beta family protein n=1 Tax=Kitasatospora sp. LaBMicrA B282 TaxID=3420949 RepID=UPI003D13FBE7
MRSIGRLARESGLTVSALRFYDSAGVFGPDFVDPQTGYRWYAPAQLADARLLCRLRRVGLPLAEIRLVLAAPDDPAAAHQVLDRHLRRLEDGLADARRELSVVRTLIDRRENPMSTTQIAGATRLTLTAADLLTALAAVRFAVSHDSAYPMLGGVLFDLDGSELRLIATDRHRLAVGAAPVRASAGETAGADVSVLLPAALVDEIGALAAEADAEQGGAEVTLLLSDATLAAEAAGRRVAGERLDLDFPDYRSLIRLQTTHRVELPADALRRAVTTGATRPHHPDTASSGPADEVQVTVLAVSEAGELRVLDEPAGQSAAPDELRVAVNRDFLLEAVAAGASGQLTLELGGTITPLAIRQADRAGNFSILMPIRLT